MLDDVRPATPVRDPDAPGEVYWFYRGTERLAVAWTDDGSIRRLVLRAPAADRVRMLGQTHRVRDASDGQIDGLTHVPYGPEPVFVRVLEHDS